MKYIGFFLLLIVLKVNAQKVVITGQILDSNKTPIGLANVDVVGNNISDVSDDYGIFHLILPADIKRGDIIVLRVSKSNYKTLTKKISASFLSTPIVLTKSEHLKNKPSPFKSEKTAVIKAAQSAPITSTTVTSYFQQGGITANQVNIAPPNRKLDNSLSAQLEKELPNKNEYITIISVWGDSEAFQFATEIFDYLKYKNYTKVYGVSQVMFNRPVIGQTLSRDTSGVQIIIGGRR